MLNKTIGGFSTSLQFKAILFKHIEFSTSKMILVLQFDSQFNHKLDFEKSLFWQNGEAHFYFRGVKNDELFKSSTTQYYVFKNIGFIRYFEWVYIGKPN